MGTQPTIAGSGRKEEGLWSPEDRKGQKGKKKKKRIFPLESAEKAINSANTLNSVTQQDPF